MNQEQMDSLIPDFDDLYNLTVEAARYQQALISLKHQIQYHEAEFIREATTNKDYWPSGKQPTVDYLARVVRILGNTPDDFKLIESLRGQLASVTEQSELAGGLLKLSRDKLDLYRTMSANERKGQF